MRLLLSAALLLCSVPANTQPPTLAPADGKRYAVIFRVATDGTGGVRDLNVERVIDPSGPGTAEEAAKRPVNVAVPAAYLAAARKVIERGERGKAATNGQSKVYYTFLIYDPAQPDRADIGVDDER